MIQPIGPGRFFCAAAGCTNYMPNDETLFCEDCQRVFFSELDAPAWPPLDKIRNGYTREAYLALIKETRDGEARRNMPVAVTVTTTVPQTMASGTMARPCPSPGMIHVENMPMHEVTDGLGNKSVMGCIPPQPDVFRRGGPFDGIDWNGVLLQQQVNELITERDALKKEVSTLTLKLYEQGQTIQLYESIIPTLERKFSDLIRNLKATFKH